MMDYTAVKASENAANEAPGDEGFFSRRFNQCGVFRQWLCRQGSCVFVSIVLVMFVFSGLFSTDHPDLPFLGEQNLAVPTVLPLKIFLSEPLKIGQYFHIYGNVSKNANDFCFSLSQAQEVRLKFCALFPNGTGENSTTTYLGLKKNGTWINETSVNPLERSEVFDFRIRFLENLVQIFANHGEIGIFAADDGLMRATEASLSSSSNGIQSLRLFRVEGRKYENPFKTGITFKMGQRLDISAQPIMRMNTTTQIAEIFDEIQPVNSSIGRDNTMTTLSPSQMTELLQTGQVAVGSDESEKLKVQEDYVPEFVRVKRRSGGGRGGGGGGRGGSRGSSAARSSSRGSSSRSSSSRSTSSRSSGSSSSRTNSRFRSGSSSSGSSSFYRHNTRLYGSSYGTTHYYGPSSYSYYFAGRIYYRSSFGCYSCRGRYRKEKPVPRSKRIDVLFFNEFDVMAFTISIRFAEDRIFFNTFKKGEWQHHVREEMPIDDWRIFDLSILMKEQHLSIYFNGEWFYDFDHRENISKRLDKVRIDGDVEIHSVSVDGRLVPSEF